MRKNNNYSLETVKKVYSYWGKSMLAYKLGVFFPGYSHRLRRRAVEMLRLRRGDVVLDLGCGPGIMFSLLEKKIREQGRIIGVDYVEEMIKQCRKLIKKKKWKNITLIRQDAAKLRLKPNSINSTISVLGLSAIPDHKTTLRKCYSALKRKGRFVVLDGKEFNKPFNILNPILRVLRWSKSYEKKDLIKDIKEVFGNIQVREYFLGSIFIAIAIKK